MENKAVSIVDKLKAIEEKIDRILAEKKLNFVTSESEIAEIFELGLENLSKMPYTKLSEYSFLLAKYNVQLQKDINKEKVTFNWAKRCMDFIVLPLMGNYRSGYMTSDEVKTLAIKDNDVAIKLYGIITEKEQVITLLSDLTMDIRKMGDYLLEISKSKRFNNNG